MIPVVLIFAGLVGTLQGVAWIHRGGQADEASWQLRLGIYLAPLGLLALVAGFALWLVPGLSS